MTGVETHRWAAAGLQSPARAEAVSSATLQRVRRRRIGGVLAAGAATGLFALWLSLRLGGPSAVRSFDDIATILAALVAAVLCLRAGLLHGGRLGRFWLLLGAACAAWTLAEVIWAVYDLVLRTPVPVPSWADVGYLGAIPLAVAALVSHPCLRGHTRRARAALDGVVIATALLFLSWSFVLGPLWRHTNLTSLGGIVAVAYPFGDVVMIFLVVLVARTMGEGDRFPLFCVLGGVIAMALSDSTYTYLVEVGRYATGNLIDTGWVAGYLGLGLGAFSERPQELAEAAEETGPPSLASLVAPFVPVLLALSVLAIEVALGHRLGRSEWLMALVLSLLVLARQLLFVLDTLATSKRIPAAPGEAGPA